MLKKIGKYVLYTLLGVIIALFLFPFVFKDKIIRAFENAVNDQVEATVTFKDADISFLRSFPDIYLSVEDISVVGKDTFEGISLLTAKKLSFDVNLFSLLSKNSIPSIEYFGIDGGKIHVMVLPDGMANYQITKQDSAKTEQDSSSFSLDIQKYELKNSSVIYTDQSLAMYVAANNINHTGKGNFATSTFDLQTSTKIDSLSIRYDGIHYLKNALTTLEAVIAVDLDKSLFALKDNALSVNELQLKGDGSVQFDEDKILIKADLGTPFEDIRQLLSIIPNAFTKDFDQVKTDGKARFQLRLDGIYHGVKEEYPAFDLEVKVDDGFIKYPGSPFPVEDLHLDVKTGAKMPDYRDLFVQIPKFQFLINKEKISGDLNVNNALKNQNFSGHIKGKMNLNDLKNALQMTSFTKLEGLLDINLAFQALMNDILAENYEKINASGNAKVEKLVVKSESSPGVSVTLANAVFSPAKLTLDCDNLTVGHSHIYLDASVQNPLAAFTMEKGVQTTIRFSADKIVLDEWMNSQPASAATTSPEVAFTKNQENFILTSGIAIDGKMDNVIYGDYHLKDVLVKGTASGNTLKLDNFSANVGKSDISATGVVNQIYDYLFKHGVLVGNIDLKSKFFDGNMFAGGNTTPAQSEPVTNYAVPERMDLTISGKFDKLMYTDLALENAEGTFHIQQNEAIIKDLQTKIFGGKIQLDGFYETKNIEHPGFSVKLDLSKIKFNEAFRQFDIFKRIMPVAEYIEGMFNTTLVMRGNLNQGMSVDLGSLDASGFIETLQGMIKAYPPLLELGNKLQIKEIHNIDLSNSRNWFEVKNGEVDIKPFQKVIKDINMDISGKHNFVSGMNVLIKMKIPRALLEKNKVTATANTGLTFVEKEAQKVGIQLGQDKNIHLNVNLSGKLKQPSIKITPVAGTGETSFGDAVHQKLEESGQKIKDSIRHEVEKQKQKAKDSLNKVLQKEVEKTKTKVEKEAEKVIETAKDKAKEQVITKIDTLTKGVISDTLKQKAKDALDKNTNKEIDKIKDKLKDFDPFKKKKD